MNIYDSKQDDLLFHYTRPDTALEKILYDGQIRLSPYRDLKDPLESKRTFVFEGDLSDLSLPNAILLNEVFVACFSVYRQEEGRHDMSFRGFTRSRMWSQYAKDHEGVCLVFSKSAILSSLRELYGKGNFYGDMVDYEDLFREAAAHSLPKADSNMDLRVHYLNHIKTHHKGLFFKKLNDYKDEVEYRIVIISEGSDYLDLPITESLKGIIVGNKFSKAYNPTVQRFAEKYQVDIHELNWAIRQTGPRLLSLLPY